MVGNTLCLGSRCTRTAPLGYYCLKVTPNPLFSSLPCPMLQSTFKLLVPSLAILIPWLHTFWKQYPSTLRLQRPAQEPSGRWVLPTPSPLTLRCHPACPPVPRDILDQPHRFGGLKQQALVLHILHGSGNWSVTLECGRAFQGAPSCSNQGKSSLPLWFLGAPCWLRTDSCPTWDGLGLSESIGQLVG